MKKDVIFRRQRSFLAIWSVWMVLSIFACEDFVKVGPPRTELIKSTVFTSDATANAAVVDIYYQLSGSGFASGDHYSISLYASLSSDELINYYTSGTPTETAELQQLNDNTILPNNSRILYLWSEAYQAIYKANAVIEGLGSSTGLSEGYIKQLEGEARFLRALCYFYLVNLFGDVPLALSTDYRINSIIGRTPTSEVYQQIISDLLEAQNLLLDTYSFSNNERVRANKGVVTALLARTYLYTGDWAKAEVQATAVIQNTAQYRLMTNLTEVFRTNSSEVILQFWQSTAPLDRIPFIVTAAGPAYGALRPAFANGFESGDQRAVLWIDNVTTGGVVYSYASKYASAGTPPLDYSTVFRLAEVYLIRAEARSQLDRIAAAQDDLNIIRSRAGLSSTPAIDKTSLLSAVENERKAELFTEWGHRWLDLKRTNRAGLVLQLLKQTWVPTAGLYPIPESQILNDPGMKDSQNPGY